MLKKTTKLIIAILLAAAFVGCPTTESGSGTSSTNSEKITSLQTVINNSEDGATINLSEYSDITTYSATINKAVTINGSSTDLNGAILTVEKDATISGITNASVTASSSLGNGSLKISSSSLSSLNIQGGGINSIVVIDVSVDTVTIDKTVEANSTDQYVRFCVDAKTKIGGMNISSSTLIDVTGDVTGNQSKPNADNYNIQFGSANICVAFNTKMGLTTPNDKARASFGGDTSSDADFFIIVNKGQAIVEKFFNQVAEKILGRDKFDPYKEGEADKFDFSKPIDGDTHFTGKPEDKPAPQIWDVTFDANGGAWTDGKTPITIKEATTDENGTVAKPADPTRTDYDFVYWYLVATETADVSFDFTKPLSGNITLKAKWAEKQQETPKVTYYTVHFDANGGTLAAGTLEDVTVDENKTVAKPADPTKDGNDFDGWYLVVDTAGTLADESYDFTTQVKANITLKAKWTEKQQETPTVQYRVHFDVNGGIWTADTSTDVTVDENKTVAEPTDPTWANHRFEGWYLVDKTSPAEESYNFAASVTGDITLQAHWTPIWTVSFDAGDGAWADNVKSLDVTVDDGNTVTAPATNPTLDGFDFVYWYLDTATNDASFDFTKPLSGNITLKAKWAQQMTTAEGSIDIQDGQFYIVMREHAEDGNADGDTWTFDLTSDQKIELTGCTFQWSYKLASGSHIIASTSGSSVYYGEIQTGTQGSTVEFRIGSDAGETAQILPVGGWYQLSIEVHVIPDNSSGTNKPAFDVSGTFDLNIMYN